MRLSVSRLPVGGFRFASVSVSVVCAASLCKQAFAGNLIGVSSKFHEQVTQVLIIYQLLLQQDLYTRITWSRTRIYFNAEKGECHKG